MENEALKKVPTLDALCLSKAKIWKDSVTDLLKLCPDDEHMVPAKKAAMVRLTLGPTLRNTLTRMSQDDKDNPTAIANFVVETCRGSEKLEKGTESGKMTDIKQKKQSLLQYVQSYDSHVAKATELGLGMDPTLWHIAGQGPSKQRPAGPGFGHI